MLQIRNTRVILSPSRVLRQHQSLVALYAKAATGCENAVSLRKRLQHREPRSWLRQSSVSLVCVINICSGSAKYRKCRKDSCSSSHNTLLHRPERAFPEKASTNNNINTSKSNAGTSRPSTGQQQPGKTTTLSSVTDVKGLLQVTELKLTSSSGTSTTALVLCDSACSNSWVSDSLAARLGLQGTTLKLAVKGINTEELIDKKWFN